MNDRIRHPGILLAVVLFLSATFCKAEDFQPQDEIIASARAYLEAEQLVALDRVGEVRMGRLDPRLRLAACDGKLEAFLPPGAQGMGNTTVGVRCPAPSWTLYLSAQVIVQGQVLVTTRPLARGERLTEEHVQLVERDLASLPRGYFDDPQPVLGQQTRRHLAADTVLNPQLIEAPRLVRRGEEVTLVADSNGFAIRSRGQAMADGSSGEVIRVRSRDSKRIIEGRVLAAGVVKVTL
ncbi:MAG: flagellar basal body P-ring formation chaperone FlgA [Gammaproteobacteria bacterium]|nr:flagellar basal body P-ring formation chaperone FlgA [Gammaproteobacteria bacterium]